MKVLTTSSSSQTIKVIPREYVSNATLTIRDDQTNATVNYSITPTTSNDELVISNTFSPELEEGHFYDMTLTNGSSEVIYKDKIYCTDQTVDQSTNDYYTINDSEYTTDTSYDDDYIVL